MIKVAVTGYYGTGSSAVIDLLSEVDNVSCAIHNRYEHTNLNCRDGIFDLETILYSDNTNYYSRDMALNRFHNEMYKQYKYNFGWYGSYKHLFGEKYMDIVDEFYNKICITKGKTSLAHTTKIRFSPIKAMAQVAAKILLKHRTVKYGNVYMHDGDPQALLIASHDEFLEGARKFINQYFDLCQKDNDIMIYDHLLYPEQCGVVDRFFDDDFRLIIVDRDPRDVYFSDKYVWNTLKNGNASMPLPNEINVFCKYWKAMHDKTIANLDSNKILKVNFEDLIYKYDETTEKIFNFLGIAKENHVRKEQEFEPKKSLYNTQVFLAHGMQEEIKIIEDKLSELLYDFPYELKNDLKGSFEK